MKRIKTIVRIRFTRIYWFLLKPKTYSAKAILLKNSELLLVRNVYGSGRWNLPGGRIEASENPKDAVRREVCEELNIEIRDTHFLGVIMGSREYKKDTVYCFMSTLTQKDFMIDPVEIMEAQWFPLTALPNNTSSIVREVLCLYESASV